MSDLFKQLDLQTKHILKQIYQSSQSDFVPVFL